MLEDKARRVSCALNAIKRAGTFKKACGKAGLSQVTDQIDNYRYWFS